MYLKVREHPSQGVFVSNLTIVKVNTFEDIMSLISIGDKNRTVASTNMNTNSSRSHSIVNLIITQRLRNQPTVRNGLPTSGLQQKISKVYLVDLAGMYSVCLLYMCECSYSTYMYTLCILVYVIICVIFMHIIDDMYTCNSYYV